MKKITPAEAKELNQNFVKTRTKAIDKSIGKKDAVSSWFSLTELKEYIAFVEQEGKAKGIDVNGLRVYFGAYSESDDDAPKKGLATVFFVPTKPKTENLLKSRSVNAVEESSDITEIDGLNNGGVGYPPSATYPQ